jgi:hypothetical protein
MSGVMARHRSLATADGVLQSLPEYLEIELHDDPDRKARPYDISYLTEGRIRLTRRLSPTSRR